MFMTLVAALILLALTVTIHAVGLVVILRRTLRIISPSDMRFWSATWLLIRVAWAIILVHLSEIALWAIFFAWIKCLPDLESAFYFSGVTYSSVGYGDLVLPKGWRLLGPVEGLTGILMCGLSTGFFFAVVNRVLGVRFEANKG